MKKWMKGFLSLMVLCMLMVVPAQAAEQTGSISVDIKAYATDEAVGGGSLKLFLVAEADGNEFTYTEAFIGCDEDLLTQEGLEKAETAETFEAWAVNHEIQADDVVDVDRSGHAQFTGLSLGLYLITQGENAYGYEAVNAFLVTVPINEDGTLIYDVDATPKTAPVEKVEAPEPEPEPVTEPGPAQPKVTTPNPKTGDMVSLGLLLVAFAAGGTVIYSYKKKKGEQS